MIGRTDIAPALILDDTAVLSINKHTQTCRKIEESENWRIQRQLHGLNWNSR